VISGASVDVTQVAIKNGDALSRMSISGLGLDRFRFRLSVTTNAGLAAKRCIASAKEWPRDAEYPVSIDRRRST